MYNNNKFDYNILLSKQSEEKLSATDLNKKLYLG